jgi:predicted nucleotidyltransferase
MITQEKMSEELIKFRSLMDCKLSQEKAKYIWGKSFTKNIGDSFPKEEENLVINRKEEILRKNVKYLLRGNLVRFIGISGSVAAGFAKDDDDIDLFIVVKDGSAWIYRGILTIRNLFNNKIRAKRHGSDVKDKFCINLICEERGIIFDNDMFNFHELMYLIPMYNEKYLNYIYSQNVWLRDDYSVKRDLMVTREGRSKPVFVLVKIINYLSFFAQLLFMIISKHSPEIRRLKENYKNGKIEFFKKEYKFTKLDDYLKIV